MVLQADGATGKDHVFKEDSPEGPVLLEEADRVFSQDLQLVKFREVIDAEVGESFPVLDLDDF